VCSTLLPLCNPVHNRSRSPLVNQKPSYITGLSKSRPFPTERKRRWFRFPLQSQPCRLGKTEFPCDSDDFKRRLPGEYFAFAFKQFPVEICVLDQHSHGAPPSSVSAVSTPEKTGGRVVQIQTSTWELHGCEGARITVLRAVGSSRLGRDETLSLVGIVHYKCKLFSNRVGHLEDYCMGYMQTYSLERKPGYAGYDEARREGIIIKTSNTSFQLD